MMDLVYTMQAYWLWLILAAVLAIAEVAIAPGIFLIFVAMAAAATGLITAATDVDSVGQLALFAILSLVAVYGGRYWYAQQDLKTSDPLLNDRAARMVGMVVTVTQPISNAGGRVRVGDGEWPARGAAQDVGAKVVITKVENGIVHIQSAT